MKPLLKQPRVKMKVCCVCVCVRFYRSTFYIKSSCNNVCVYDCLCIRPSTTFNNPMQILTLLPTTPSSLKKQTRNTSSPPEHPTKISHPSPAIATLLIPVRVFKKSFGHRIAQTSPGPGAGASITCRKVIGLAGSNGMAILGDWMWMDELVLSAKRLNLHKD